MAPDDDAIPTGRLRRTAKVGQVVGSQGARYAGTRARNVTRSPQRAMVEIDRRHLEAAEQMVEALGTLKGAAMKIGQLASFVDTEFIPEEYRELYQSRLSTLRTCAPPMPWRRVREILEEEWAEPPEALFEEFEEQAAAAASIGQVHRAVLPDGRRVAVKVQYPDIARALRADLDSAGLVLRLAKALAPGLDAGAAARELRARVLEELDYEHEAQSQRAFARAYRGHPFVHVPDVVTRLSRDRVLVSEWVEGLDFEGVKALPRADRDRFGEIVFRFSFGSVYHLRRFNADVHPGNYLLMDDGRVAFLDFGMTKQLDDEQIELEIAAVEAVLADDPERLRVALHELGFIGRPGRVEAERLMEHVKAIGGWYLEDREVTVDSQRVMRAIAASSDPRSGFFDLMRRENLPANELLGRRMEFGVLAVLGQLRATRNWCAIACEWCFGAEPATELGRAEWDFFSARRPAGTPRRPRRREAPRD